MFVASSQMIRNCFTHLKSHQIHDAFCTFAQIENIETSNHANPFLWWTHFNIQILAPCDPPPPTVCLMHHDKPVWGLTKGQGASLAPLPPVVSTK